VLDLQTGKVIRSAISSEDFAVFPLWKFRAETPHAFEIPNCITLHAFRIPVQEPPPPPSEFQVTTHGIVWIFSGITQLNHTGGIPEHSVLSVLGCDV